MRDRTEWNARELRRLLTGSLMSQRNTALCWNRSTRKAIGAPHSQGSKSELQPAHAYVADQQQCVLLLAALEAKPKSPALPTRHHTIAKTGATVHLQLGACCAAGPSAPCTPWALIPATATTSQVKLTVQSTLA